MRHVTLPADDRGDANDAIYLAAQVAQCKALIEAVVNEYGRFAHH